MNGLEKIGRIRVHSSVKATRRVRASRIRSAVLSVAIGGGASMAGTAVAATFTTSDAAPTGPNIQISQPDNSYNPAANGTYQDYTNCYEGVGQVFTPVSNFLLTGFTFQGSGAAGGTLTGNWTITIASLNGNSNYFGAAFTTLDVETADGTPIANDVANGITTNYDTVTLATPLALAANQKYLWAISSPGGSTGYNTSGGATGGPGNGGNGYYCLAGSTPVNPSSYQQNTTSTEYPGGESADIADGEFGTTSGQSIFQMQNADHTFFISGTVATSTATQWALNGNGNWQTGANWSSGTAPQFAGDTATFGSDNGAITVSPVVTLSNPVTVDSLTFSAPSGASNGGYNISGSGILNCGPTITVLSGNHLISATFNLVDNYNNASSGTFSIASGASLTIPNLTGGAYGNLILSGGGTLAINNTDNMNLQVTGATLTTIAGGGESGRGYDNFNGGAIFNVNTVVDIAQWFDDGNTDQLNISSTGSIVTAGNSDYIQSTVSGSGSILFGGGSFGGGGAMAELCANNINFSGPITITNGYTLQIGNQYFTAADAALGNASATNTVTLDSGTLTTVNSFAGTHSIIINGGGGTINTAGFNIGIGSISGVGGLSVIGGGILSIAPQAVALNASGGIRTLILGGLNITASSVSFGTAAVQQNRTLLVTRGLSLSGATGAWTASLDLGGNDMIVQNGNLATITDQIKQGYAGGTWQGSGGIMSAAAAGNAAHLTTLGVIQNSGDGTTSGATLYSTFDGTSSSNSVVLVKYTYYGDANLDGQVDGSDYSRIDYGYTAHATGWFNGDFNYDGVVDGSDYTLIDNAFNTQGASLASLIAAPTAQVAGAPNSAVPEPAGVALLGIGAAGLLRRRRTGGMADV